MNHTTADIRQTLSIKKAADRLDCSKGHVVNLIRAGRLDAVDIGIDAAWPHNTRMIRVFVDSIERFLGGRELQPLRQCPTTERGGIDGPF